MTFHFSSHVRDTRLLRFIPGIIAAVFLLAGCAGPQKHLSRADDVAREILASKQQEALGRTEPFTIESAGETLRKRLLEAQNLQRSHPASLGRGELEHIEHWPGLDEDFARDEAAAPPIPVADGPIRLTLQEALEIAAASSRDFQDRKENVFQTALVLDLERNTFRNIFSGEAQSGISTDLGGSRTVTGSESSASTSLSRTLKSGAALTTSLAFDLVKLLTAERPSSLGIIADASISIPLWRGAGRHIVTEPLVQAERDVVYAIWEFERFKRSFAVDTATRYLGVLSQLDQVENAEDNYRRLVSSTRRARRLADAGRLPEIQVDQARQDELRARNRWVSARQSYASTLDQFKIFLGLPPDAQLELDRDVLQSLAEKAQARLNIELEQAPPDADTALSADASIELRMPDMRFAGPYEIEPQRAVALALEHRLDLRSGQEQIYDAQRKVVVAADALGGEFTLLGSARAGERRSLGTAGLDNAQLRPEKGFYSALLSLDLPFERTAERNTFRNSLIALDRQVRSFQELEDRIKLEVRNGLRDLLEFREGLRIQAQAVRVAQRRVESTSLFLQAGRAEIRDLLEAQEALVSARNALTSALLNYRIAELALQRDMGVLQVNEKGLWIEYPVADLNTEDRKDS
ncbi:TolC family protein [Geoalkalibacter subterraneus]|uniref:TolC family protein n=1 Tax=Geoalkalibacter subterraneus TaxID=483547 RepID=UPI000A00751D|nr:TolC family protein [Geoalkalibacter subterraneus]